LSLDSADNPVWFATEALVNRCTGGNLDLHEAMTRKVTRVRDHLAGPNPSQMERLLAERAALCWLDCALADLRQARGQARLTRAQSDHLSRDRDRAHRRFLTALTTAGDGPHAEAPRAPSQHRRESRERRGWRGELAMRGLTARWSDGS
jgi:hypothetical protein